jgi:hypothetical protein
MGLTSVSGWFIACHFFDPEDGDDKFLRSNYIKTCAGLQSVSSKEDGILDFLAIFLLLLENIFIIKRI